MRRNTTLILMFAAIIAVPLAFTVFAQNPPQPGEQPVAEKEEPRQYVKVTAEQINRFGTQFDGSYVQLADVFGEEITQFPSDLRRYGVTANDFILFRTQRALGSNMLCIAERENPDVQATFAAPLPPESPIYLMGRVGPRIIYNQGPVTLFFVDRMARGNQPPVTKVEVKKPSRVRIEWQGATGIQRQDYLIPEMNKRYEIQDPFDPTKRFFLTLVE